MEKYRNNFFCKRIRRRDEWGGRGSEKCNNLCSSAKLAYHEIHKERQKTGGGTTPPDLSEETAHIVDMMDDKSGFVGIDHGIDSFNINVETHEEEVPKTMVSSRQPLKAVELWKI